MSECQPTKHPMMQPCRRGCGELVHLENDGFHVCREQPTSKPLVERLRKATKLTCGWPGEDEIDPLLYEAADEVERLRAALERIAYCAEGGSDVERIAEDALGVADEPKAALTGVEFLHTWMRTPNPLLGGVAPLAMLKAGRGEKLAQFIENAHAESESDAQA